MHKQDTWIGIITGSVGGATKFYLTIEPHFFTKFFEAGATALFCGLCGVAGKELWYFIKKKYKK
jgi:uncharacterized membrane protein YjjP (DUF1212 family)